MTSSYALAWMEAVPFSVACAQLAYETLDPTSSLAKARESIAQATALGADLVLLPEYATTGLVFDERILAHGEPVGGPTTSQFRQWSRQYHCWIGGGIVERAGDRFYNTFVLVAPSGQMWSYRKRYPAFFENLWFTRGRTSGIIQTELGRIGLMICWDMIHGRLVREMRGRIDLLLITSAWPDLTTGNISLPGLQSWLSRPPRVQPSKLARQLGVPVVYCNMGGRFTTQVPGLGLTYESAMAGRSAILDSRGIATGIAEHNESSLVSGNVDVPGFRTNRVAA